jgi:putative transposase
VPLENSSSLWKQCQAGNLAADLGPRTESLRFLLRDRDGKYGEAFDAVSSLAGSRLLSG